MTRTEQRSRYRTGNPCGDRIGFASTPFGCNSLDSLAIIGIHYAVIRQWNRSLFLRERNVCWSVALVKNCAKNKQRSLTGALALGKRLMRKQAHPRDSSHGGGLRAKTVVGTGGANDGLAPDLGRIWRVGGSRPARLDIPQKCACRSRSEDLRATASEGREKQLNG